MSMINGVAEYKLTSLHYNVKHSA